MREVAEEFCRMSRSVIVCKSEIVIRQLASRCYSIAMGISRFSYTKTTLAGTVWFGKILGIPTNFVSVRSCNARVPKRTNGWTSRSATANESSNFMSSSCRNAQSNGAAVCGSFHVGNSSGLSNFFAEYCDDPLFLLPRIRSLPTVMPDGLRNDWILG